MNLSLRTLHQVAMYSGDLDRSIEFYRDKLGADFIVKFDPPGLAFFRFGDTRILLEENARRATIYFRVDDISAAAGSLRAKGIEFEQEPEVVYREEEGLFGPVGMEEWMAFFRDPDGNLLAIVSQVVPKA